MTSKHLLLSLEDDNAKALGETIANKTSRKIVSFLAEEEASENKIAKALGIPINTVEYNLKKLLQAGLIEKAKKFFWSEKGKKIDIYKVANKLIIIAPKKSSFRKLKSFLPVFLVAAAFTIFTWLYSKTKIFTRPIQETLKAPLETFAGAGNVAPAVMSAATDTAAEVATKGTSIAATFGPLEYFLIGIWAIIVIFFIYSLVKGGSSK